MGHRRENGMEIEKGNILRYEVIIIGSGPAGLAAAAAAASAGVSCCIVEREERAGGILKQCIHDGFGLVRYGERLTGPEYASRELEKVRSLRIPIHLSTYLVSVRREEGQFLLTGVGPEGVIILEAPALVLATGCRERTARQIFLHGSRPAGVYTAGLAQYFINIQGYLPARRCIILGSGDIGLIMARRFVLEGAEVEGVYEIMPRPSGLPRNIAQCLEDYSIPLHLSTTVSRIHGRERVEGVTLVNVDDALKPVPGSERYVECDALVLSVGLIPENEIAADLGVEIDPVTRGPVVDDGMMTSVPGLYSCGNALHVSDLADYVSATGETAGRDAARYVRRETGTIPESSLSLITEGPFLYILPQRIRCGEERELTFYFRAAGEMEHARVSISMTDENGIGTSLKSRRFTALRPAEMEEIRVRIPDGKAVSCRALLEVEG